MSRAYRVRLQTATRHVKSSDELEIDLALLGILPEAEMKSLLEDALQAEGWRKSGNKLVRTFGEVEAEIDEEMGTVSLRLERKKEVVASARNLDEAQRRAADQAESTKEKLDRTVAKALSDVEASVRESVQGALQKTYVTALEKKARAMGEVESIDRTEGADGDLEIVIKVKV